MQQAPEPQPDLYSLLVQSLPQCVVLLYDAGLRYQRVEGPGLADSGFTREALEGRTIFETYPADVARSCEPYYREALAGRPSSHEVALAGRHYLVHNTRVPGAPGEPPRGMAIALDITDRRRAEAALAHRESLLEAMFEAEPECVKILGADGSLLMMNPAGLAMIEADTMESVAGHCVYPLVVSEHQQAFKELIARVVAGGKGTLVFEVVGLKGGRRCLETRMVPFRHPSDGSPAALGVTRDITEQRRLEDQLRQSQKMEAVGQLAGGIAHDFNNLMTAVLGYTGILEVRLGHLGNDPLARENLEAIRAAAVRASSLTRQLLAFSRRQVLNPAPLDLNEVIGRLEPMLRRLIGENIAMEVSQAPGLPLVRADAAQIEQVILNLAVNARDAMPSGGTLRMATGTSGPAAERVVTLRVEDTGEGMDEATAARVFEPFFTTKELGKGTGLGLSTVYGIVQQTGGRIALDTAPGRGAAFRIDLPATDDRPAEAPARANPAPIPAGTETILLVEDEPLVRDVTAHLLRQSGYAVLTAGEGAEARSIAANHDGGIDLLITDVIMPGDDGRAVAAGLAADRPGLKVLLISGYPERAGDAPEELDSRLPLLEKPFTAEALGRAVRDLLDGGRGPA